MHVYACTTVLHCSPCFAKAYTAFSQQWQGAKCMLLQISYIKEPTTGGRLLGYIQLRQFHLSALHRLPAIKEFKNQRPLLPGCYTSYL